MANIVLNFVIPSLTFLVLGGTAAAAAAGYLRRFRWAAFMPADWMDDNDYRAGYLFGRWNIGPARSAGQSGAEFDTGFGNGVADYVNPKPRPTHPLQHPHGE